MIVAPVSRTSIIVGKCLGGATIAASQGVIVLALAGLVDVPYDPLLILGAFGLLVLLAFTVSAFGVLVAVTIKQAQTFTWVMQLVVFPMVFLSGALYPVAGLPAWLEVLNRINPLTYAVDPMRHLVFSHLDVSETARRTLDPGVTWFGWQLPPLFEVGMVLLLGLAMLGLAIRLAGAAARRGGDGAAAGPGDDGRRDPAVLADGVRPRRSRLSHPQAIGSMRGHAHEARMRLR